MNGDDVAGAATHCDSWNGRGPSQPLIKGKINLHLEELEQFLDLE